MKPGLILHTCDAYSFLWDGWYHYFNKHWNFDADIYFLNEEIDVDYKNVIQLKSGKGEWSDRLLYGLKNIPNDTVFYMQEDFWPTKPISNLDKNLYYFDQLQADCFKIHGSLLNRKFYHTYQTGIKDVLKFEQSSPYIMSHQFSIWNKEFFMSCLKPNESPWKNEKEATKRLREVDFNIYGVNDNWYEAVCRRGELTNIGVLMQNNINNEI